jgi:N-acetylmuramic acid 6-phosphate etherase
MTTLRTEQPHPEHARLDELSTHDLVDTLLTDQGRAASAVHAAAEQICAAVSAAVARLEKGGKLVYVGAGTSGRLGLLDSVELHPTFSWPRERVAAILAGGPGAAHGSIEGAEDDRGQAAADLRAARIGAQDVVVLLAASGSTPYVMSALHAARAAGALTIGIANNPGSELATGAEVGITLDTGPEIISGSTRLKAGTAQKIALNTFSSAVMVRLNKVYGNLMVDLRPTNAKLVRRAIRLTAIAAGVDEERARHALEACEFQVKVAIVAISRDLDIESARARLAAAHGSVRAALAKPGR